jgi:mono/diheme cytochrome c family protein
MKPLPRSTRERLARACWLTSACACLPIVAHAAESASGADVASGRQIAMNVCSSCHVAAPYQTTLPVLNPPAPAFADIANRPAQSAAKLRSFILTTHWDGKTVPVTMPNPMLLDDQARAVARYIMSLRRS